MEGGCACPEPYSGISASLWGDNAPTKPQEKFPSLQMNIFYRFLLRVWNQSWIRSLHNDIKKCVFVLISTSQLPTIPPSRQHSGMLTRCSRWGKQQLPAPCWELRPSAGIRAFWRAGLKTPVSSGSLVHYTGAWSETWKQVCWKD